MQSNSPLSILLCVLQIYEGKIDPWVMSDNCTDNVPVLIKRATFCSAFAADARDFRQYNSWVRLLSHNVKDTAPVVAGDHSVVAAHHSP